MMSEGFNYSHESVNHHSSSSSSPYYYYYQLSALIIIIILIFNSIAGGCGVNDLSGLLGDWQ